MVEYYNADYARNVDDDRELSAVRIKKARQELGEDVFKESYLVSLVNEQTEGIAPQNLHLSEKVAVYLTATSEQSKDSNSISCNSTSSSSTSDGRDSQAPCAKFNKRNSVVHQEDFYALLVQSEKGRREHLYDITAELEPFETKDGQKFPLNSKNGKLSAANRLQYLKNHAHVQLLGGKTLANGFVALDVISEKSPNGIEGQLFWTVSMDLKPGEYHIELGSRALGICAQTEAFNITEAFGVEDHTSIGYVLFLLLFILTII